MSSEVPLADLLASVTISALEAGQSREQVAERAMQFWLDMGEPADLFESAAEAVRRAPQPISESAEKVERMCEIRDRLGVQPVEDQLLAALDARELLVELAGQAHSR